jgi:hypothetical protein
MIKLPEGVGAGAVGNPFWMSIYFRGTSYEFVSTQGFGWGNGFVDGLGFVDLPEVYPLHLVLKDKP